MGNGLRGAGRDKPSQTINATQGDRPGVDHAARPWTRGYALGHAPQCEWLAEIFTDVVLDPARWNFRADDPLHGASRILVGAPVWVHTASCPRTGAQCSPRPRGGPPADALPPQPSAAPSTPQDRRPHPHPPTNHPGTEQGSRRGEVSTLTTENEQSDQRLCIGEALLSAADVAAVVATVDAALVAAAVATGNRHALDPGNAQALDITVEPCNVLLIGDTPADVAAGPANQVPVLAVTSGQPGIEDLQAAGATETVPDLRDPSSFLKILAAEH